MKYRVHKTAYVGNCISLLFFCLWAEVLLLSLICVYICRTTVVQQYREPANTPCGFRYTLFSASRISLYVIPSHTQPMHNTGDTFILLFILKCYNFITYHKNLYWKITTRIMFYCIKTKIQCIQYFNILHILYNI